MENKVILEGSRIYNSSEIRISGKEMLKLRALKLYIILTSIFTVLGGLFIGLSIYFNNDITILVSGILILTMVLLMWGMYIYTYIKTVKKDYKDTEYKYTFCSNEVIINTNATNLSQHMVIKYSDLVRVVKCKTFTFLFINKGQALFFLNDDLTSDVYEAIKGNVNKFNG